MSPRAASRASRDLALRPPAHRKPLLGALVLALPVALFLPAADHAWLNYDDNVYITENPDLRLGLGPEGVAWAFTTFHGANWFPLTWLSWMLDYELHGLDPEGFHTTDLLLHSFNGLLLFLALSKMTGSLWRSAFVAAVFAAHPLHVESVAWASARKDPLSGLFFMLALWTYAGSGREGPSPRRRGLLLLWLALGSMAKPIVVTLPVALLLLDEWPLGRLREDGAPERWDARRVRRALWEKLPLFAAAMVLGAIAFLAQRGGGTVVSLERLPVGVRIANALVSYVTYLGQALWPQGLAVIYPHRGIELPGWQPAAAAALLFGLTALAARAARRRPYWAVGWLWYLVTLLPAIGLIQVGSQAMADRYTYLPLIGLSIVAAWGAPDLLVRWSWRSPALAVAALAAIAALSACTWLQLRHWRDSESLFAHALAVTRDNYIAHAHFGAALIEQGRIEEGLVHYREAVRLRPDFLRALNNLAWLLATSEDERVRNPFLAVRLAERAGRLSAKRDARILDTLAAAYGSANRFEEATRVAGKALRLAQAAGDRELAEQLRERLELYRAERPYREKPGN